VLTKTTARNKHLHHTTCSVASLLVESANRRAAATSLSLGRDPRIPGLGSSSWAGGSWAEAE